MKRLPPRLKSNFTDLLEKVYGEMIELKILRVFPYSDLDIIFFEDKVK